MPIGIYDRTKCKQRTKPLGRIIVNCYVCGKETIKYPSEVIKSKTGRFTCSRKCAAGLQSSAPVICDNCGIQFRRKEHMVKKFKTHFCSKDCQREYDIRSKLVPCSYCGKEIRKIYSVIALRTDFFCNHECMANYNKTGSIVKCDWCGKEIYKPLNRLFKLNFCSQDCRFAHIDHNANGRLPYPKQWKEALRRHVRDRDNHTCQICLKHESEFSQKLHVHHIDENKENCDIDNLISLCSSDHAKIKGNTPLKEVLKYEVFIENFINNPVSMSV